MKPAARRTASTFLACLLLSAASACSGTPSSDLFGGVPDARAGLMPADDAASSDDAATSAGDGGGNAPDAALGADAPVGPPPASDAAGSAPDVTVADSGSFVDAGAPADASAGGDDSGPAGTMSCGNATCTLPAEFCCVTFAPRGGQMQACATDPASCMGQGGSPVQCTSSTQCVGGQVCCGSNNNSFYSDVSCQPAPCVVPPHGVEQVQFCDPQAPGDCPPNAPQCQQSMVLNGFFVCQ
jgi:hypothetical protein